MLPGIQLWFNDSIHGDCDSNPVTLFASGGLFLESSLPCSSVSFIISSPKELLSPLLPRNPKPLHAKKADLPLFSDGFLSMSLSIKQNDAGFDHGSNGGVFADKSFEEDEKEKKLGSRRTHAINTTKHLWSGAVAAMVSRTVVAPLERLKLEYMVLGEQKNLFQLINTIMTNQGFKGFWKGNFVNILRTAPFKAINFYAYDTYRKHLLNMSGNEETTNFERFLAGAASGITATILCLPMDTVRTKMVAPGGEALGGVIGTFRHMIQTEGFFSLYKGLVPSIISMAPSGAVFYGVYDILKSAYLHSPEGRKRIQQMSAQGQDLNAFDQMELGPLRTLLYGAIAGTCAEAATYPFEVVRRQLQMQVQATKLSALATCVKIVEQKGVPALYAGLVPSLLQIHTKKNKLEQEKLNQLVCVKYNQKLKWRYDHRDAIDPISLKDIDECNEWIMGRMQEDIERKENQVLDDDMLDNEPKPNGSSKISNVNKATC